MDEKTKKIEEKAEIAKKNAKIIYWEAFWYNQKMNILVYGGFTIILLMFSLWIVRIII